MTLKVRCEQCGKVSQFSPSDAGMTALCVACGARFVIPAGNASDTVIPDAAAGTLHVEYLFASMQGIATPKPLELVFGGDDVHGWHFKDEPDHRVRSVSELSEYLLVPVFSGYPRYATEPTS